MFPAQSSSGGIFLPSMSWILVMAHPLITAPVDGVTHTYNRPGIFTLKFMAGTQCDRWRSGSFVLNIPAPLNYSPATPECVPVNPSAGFIGSPTSGTAPLTVQFTSTSTWSECLYMEFWRWRYFTRTESPPYLHCAGNLFR